MELFFSREIDGSFCRLDADESAHCVKVLRHREGDDIHVIDGEGTLYTCRILSASPKEVEAQVTGVERDWGAHPYRLRMAVCPTKNTDRYEWFAEKATELGVDVITPVIGDHSERKVFKTDRLKRILLSASKQSLKGAVPQVDEALPLRDLIRSYASSDEVLKLICCCYEGEEKRTSIGEVLLDRDTPPEDCATLGNIRGGDPSDEHGGGPAKQDIRGMEYPDPKIVILIGPEGDFSREEVALALECGFRPVHLGPSRLRTETAALAAVAAVYFHYCGDKGM
ncbi:MAG: 16S rRNA (uracil(1498)-N(3))-methyltransferase [Bacteroidales bacterium]|nr:16S rRNA (uracil(1498)-N(3))-methyltransferase [Bacteroidales bacterium]